MRILEEIESPRLLLRKSSIVDAHDIYRNYATDEVVTQYLPWNPHADIYVTRRFLQECNESWRDGTDYSYSVVHKAEQQVIGMISLRPAAHSVEVGYVLAREYWGQGLTTEALVALSDWCLDQPEIWRVEAYCDIQNKASARVMAKAGMQQEGILRKYLSNPGHGTVPQDAFLYARVKEDLKKP